MSGPFVNRQPYATWKPERATDEPDELPDRAIVPLIEDLRAAGVVTLQSCAGHSGSHDGTLWMRGGGTPPVPLRHPFSAVRHTFWPEDRWEIEWYPDDFAKAEAAIRFYLLKSHRAAVRLPVEDDDLTGLPVLDARFPMTERQWKQMQDVLASMKPGLVRDES